METKLYDEMKERLPNLKVSQELIILVEGKQPTQ